MRPMHHDINLPDLRRDAVIEVHLHAWLEWPPLGRKRERCVLALNEWGSEPMIAAYGLPRD